MKKVALLLALMTRQGWAATGPVAPPDIWQWLLSCFLVIGLILGLAWLLKRSRILPGVSQQSLRVLSVLPLGTKEKLLVVKVGEDQLLLGMTPTSITLLHKLDTPLPEQMLTPPFAAQLGKWMQSAKPTDGGKDEV